MNVNGCGKVRPASLNCSGMSKAHNNHNNDNNPTSPWTQRRGNLPFPAAQPHNTHTLSEEMSYFFYLDL